MSEQGYAVKVQFSTSSKIYEYFLPPDVEPPPMLLSLTELRAVVDARGRTKIVKVVGIIPYEDRFFDGDLKPVMALFDGPLIYEEPDEYDTSVKRTKAPTETPPSHFDDDLPF